MRLLADENFNNLILRGLKQVVPDADITRVQDTEMAGKPDPLVLEWAEKHGFIILTHDIKTMRADYYARVRDGLPVPGVFLIHNTKPVGDVIDALELILLASDESEWMGEIRYVPL